jgi:hypothetical protein
MHAYSLNIPKDNKHITSIESLEQDLRHNIDNKTSLETGSHGCPVQEEPSLLGLKAPSMKALRSDKNHNARTDFLVRTYFKWCLPLALDATHRTPRFPSQTHEDEDTKEFQDQDKRVTETASDQV